MDQGILRKVETDDPRAALNAQLDEVQALLESLTILQTAQGTIEV